MRRTRIIATIGPAVGTPEKIEELLRAGVNIARLNMSHGDHETQTKWLGWIRSISEKLNRPVGVLADLSGPKIRTGTFSSGGTLLEPGATFTITTRSIVGDHKEVSTTYAGLPHDVKEGDRILLDDGTLELEATYVTDTDVVTRVIIGGFLKDRKGINLPGVKISAPSLTKKDLVDLEWAIAHDVDFVAISFVRTAHDVADVKKIIAAAGKRIPVIAKIEKPEAVDNLEAIVEISNGVMVARGDLGIEVRPEKVPLIQKRIIEMANKKGVTVITATQMLESMITNPRPTRAEASDVANAILDGSDAVMLSGETASGKYPVEAVRMMVSIAEEVETRVLERIKHSGEIIECELPMTGILLQAARNTVGNIPAKFIVVFSASGRSARLLSKYRPKVEILALTDNVESYRRMALYWGVIPVMVPTMQHVEQMIQQMDTMLQETGYVQSGDVVVVLFGTVIGISGTLNSMRLVRIGEKVSGWLYRTE